MREIKFRAWAVASRVMFFPDELEMFEGKLLAKPNTILEQFTGLHDKNGKEIYEGDMIDLSRDKFPDDTPNPMEVVFIDGSFRRKYKKWPEELPYPILRSHQIKFMSYIVIGTIHDKETT